MKFVFITVSIITYLFALIIPYVGRLEDYKNNKKYYKFLKKYIFTYPFIIILIGLSCAYCVIIEFIRLFFFINLNNFTISKKILKYVQKDIRTEQYDNIQNFILALFSFLYWGYIGIIFTKLPTFSGINDVEYLLSLICGGIFFILNILSSLLVFPTLQYIYDEKNKRSK